MPEQAKTPGITIDIIIEMNSGAIVLIERKNLPYGWALPGGFVNYGESLEEAAVREAEEETSLTVRLNEQFHTYSEPQRDPRRHNVSTVFIAQGRGVLNAKDDARRADIFSEQNLPKNLAFDHARILRDYFHYKKTGRRPGIAANPAS